MTRKISRLDEPRVAARSAGLEMTSWGNEEAARTTSWAKALASRWSFSIQ